MKSFLLVSIIQGLSIMADEFIFHHKRGLPKWERASHPFDTSLVIGCLLFLYFVDRSPTTEIIYFILAGISCIAVTKDEWIHSKYCQAEEMWLHAVLFAMHPLVLFTAMMAWESARPAILAVACFVAAFLSYEVIYWNFIRPRLNKQSPEPHKTASRDDLYEYFGD